jgi:hypothetical protein
MKKHSIVDCFIMCRNHVYKQCEHAVSSNTRRCDRFFHTLHNCVMGLFMSMLTTEWLHLRSSVTPPEYQNSRQNIIILFWKYLVNVRREARQNVQNYRTRFPFRLFVYESERELLKPVFCYIFLILRL